VLFFYECSSSEKRKALQSIKEIDLAERNTEHEHRNPKDAG
jgi:hypothetical protein